MLGPMMQLATWSHNRVKEPKCHQNSVAKWLTPNVNRDSPPLGMGLRFEPVNSTCFATIARVRKSASVGRFGTGIARVRDRSRSGEHTNLAKCSIFAPYPAKIPAETD